MLQAYLKQIIFVAQAAGPHAINILTQSKQVQCIHDTVDRRQSSSQQSYKLELH